MKYFVIKPLFNEEFIFIEPEDVIIPKEFSLKITSGKNIVKQFVPILKNRKQNLRKTDFIAGVFTIPIISLKLKKIIQNCTEDKFLQFQRANLINVKNGEVDDNFFHLHILNTIDAIDLYESSFILVYKDENEHRVKCESKDLKKLPSNFRIKKANKIVIDETKVMNRAIFRIDKISSLIIINESLKNKIEEAGLIGIDIQPLETYSY